MMEILVKYLSVAMGFPDDQIRCFLCYLFSFPLAFVFYSLFNYKRVSVAARHLYGLSAGLAFALFCFGARDTFLLILAVGVAYVILRACPPRVVHWYMLSYALICAVMAHTYCMIFDYGGWKMNYTVPLMIIVQRITYVSCELHDGLGRPDNELTEDQRNLKITQVPSILEFVSYNFNFNSFIGGPSCPYKEYIDFVTGSNIKLIDNPNKYARAKEHAYDPSPFYPALIKSIIAFTNLSLYAVLNKFCTKELILDPGLNFVLRTLLMYLFIIRRRCFYYFVFHIGESICNASGLGFHGYDEKGHAQWDLVKNARILEVELPLNMRSVISCWHIMTANWLRRCVYERVSSFPTLCTFMVSALWHGLYPGYHIAFAMFSLGTIAGRKLRYLFHSQCQTPGYVKFGYDLSGIVITSIWRDFSGLPFILLTFKDTLTALGYYYYVPLVICIILTLLPVSKQKKKSS